MRNGTGARGETAELLSVLERSENLGNVCDFTHVLPCPVLGVFRYKLRSEDKDRCVFFCSV
jgi:hypothetical protein